MSNNRSNCVQHDYCLIIIVLFTKSEERAHADTVCCARCSQISYNYHCQLWFPLIAQLVEQWTVVCVVIHRSLVQIRLKGQSFFACNQAHVKKRWFGTPTGQTINGPS